VPVTLRMKTASKPQTLKVAVALLLTFALPVALVIVAEMRIRTLVAGSEATPHVVGAVR
jgi:hypothetical protein